jgi:hypothetical protein
MAPPRGPATVPLTFRIPLPLVEKLDRMQQQTGRTGTSLVIEGLRLLEFQLSLTRRGEPAE